MKFSWFKRIGWFYIPITLQGWLILGMAIIYVIYSFIDIDSRSHSASDTLINWMFQVLMTGAVYTLLGYMLSRSQSRI
jgi:hypothetical protein